MGLVLLDAPATQRATVVRPLPLPLAFTLGLGAFMFLGSVRENVVLLRTFEGAYLQACAQGSVTH